MTTDTTNELTLHQKMILINSFSGIVLNSSTPMTTIDKFIELVKNESTTLKIHYVIELIKTINSNAKDSNHE